jgi:hypothetical protein
MSKEQKPNVGGLNCEEVTKEIKEPVQRILQTTSDTPLFLRDTSDGKKGDAQDEKDKTGE